MPSARCLQHISPLESGPEQKSRADLHRERSDLSSGGIAEDERTEW
jgi:hypothetical protein